MKIKYKSRKIKVEERLKWHKKFIIFPRKVSDHELNFLCMVVRKLKDRGQGSNDLYEDIIHGYFMWPCYEYKSTQAYITEKLKNK